MEKQISIIIPTYNMEKYIGKCLDSLLIPDFDQVEVLVVNDGSKDRSSEIAHSYADRYPQTIRVIDKGNGNYGSCINIALPLATGRYIKVLDADDTFDSSEFSKLVKTLRQINDDVVITNYSTVSIYDKLIKKTQHPVNIDLDVSIDVVTARRDVINCYIDMHQLAYNKDVFDRFEYVQSEGISYTDAQWVMFPLSYCKTFRCLDITVYKYLLGRDGQTMSDGQMSQSLNNLFSMLKDSIVTLNKTRDQNAAIYIQHLIIGRIDYVYQKALSYISENTIRIWSEFDSWLLENSPILYGKVNDLCYSKLVKSYKVFADIRKKNFPTNYKIPLYVRGLIFIKAKFLN